MPYKDPAKAKESHAARYLAHQEEAKAKQREWNAANVDKAREYRESHKEQYKVHAAKYHAAHREEIAERHAKNENTKTTIAAWREANPEKMRAYAAKWRESDIAHSRALDVNNSARRRARKLKATISSISLKQLNQKLSYWGNKCWMCSGPFEHWDHVKPLSKGGAHCLSNLRPACASCNTRKKDKWPFEKVA